MNTSTTGAALSKAVRPYVRMFGARGAWRFVTAGFFSRLTTSMLGLALVLAITVDGDQYAVAGVVAAAVVLASGVCGPIAGRLVDRYGQAVVLLVTTIVFALALSAMMLAVAAGAPDWSLIPLAMLSGASMPVAGPLVRARWTKILAGTELLRTAYAFEAATTELVYIAGPILVALVATGLGPVPGLVAVLACAVLGTLALAAQRGTQPEPHRSAMPRGGGVMRIGALRLLFVVMFGLGAILGSVELVTIARATQLGHRGLTGILLGLFGVGSMVAGLVLGGLHIRIPIVWRLVVLVGTMMLVLVPLVFASSAVGLAVLLVLAGVVLAPSLITTMEIMQRVVPADAFTESSFWLTSAMAFGMTAGNALAGVAVDRLPAGGHLFVVPIAFSMITAGTLLARHSTLKIDDQVPGAETTAPQSRSEAVGDAVPGASS